MGKGFFLLLGLFFFLTIIQPQEVMARLLPRFRSAGSGTITSSRPSSGVSLSLRLRADRLALLVYFGNLQNASSVTYNLTYETNGKPEGVSGTLRLRRRNSESRTLLFGTCSGGVCRYHPNISNMRFKVVSKLTSGKTSIKRYRIRI